ncbi:MAG TPA: flavoprotein [Streptosporangiaceae bacterium]|nr:flavoprotein [Streptosporangiaceae bacterium]
MASGTASGVLYLVASAAGPVPGIPAVITAAQQRGWDVCLILTPTAARWLDADLEDLARLSGHPVRSAYKQPGEPDVLPPPDAVLVAPATFNTVNKWAAGISDTLALGLINEAIGMGIPVAAVPWVHGPLAAHPALAASIARLRGAGVTVLDEAGRDAGAAVPGSAGADGAGLESASARGASAGPGGPGPDVASLPVAPAPAPAPAFADYPWERALDALG